MSDINPSMPEQPGKADGVLNELKNILSDLKANPPAPLSAETPESAPQNDAPVLPPVPSASEFWNNAAPMAWGEPTPAAEPPKTFSDADMIKFAGSPAASSIDPTETMPPFLADIVKSQPQPAPLPPVSDIPVAPFLQAGAAGAPFASEAMTAAPAPFIPEMPPVPTPATPVPPPSPVFEATVIMPPAPKTPPPAAPVVPPAPPSPSFGKPFESTIPPVPKAPEPAKPVEPPMSTWIPPEAEKPAAPAAPKSSFPWGFDEPPLPGDAGQSSADAGIEGRQIDLSAGLGDEQDKTVVMPPQGAHEKTIIMHSNEIELNMPEMKEGDGPVGAAAIVREPKPSEPMPVACYFSQGMERQAQLFMEHLKEAGQKTRRHYVVRSVADGVAEKGALKIAESAHNGYAAGARITFVLLSAKERRALQRPIPTDKRLHLVPVEFIEYRSLYADIFAEVRRELNV